MFKYWEVYRLRVNLWSCSKDLHRFPCKTNTMFSLLKKAEEGCYTLVCLIGSIYFIELIISWCTKPKELLRNMSGLYFSIELILKAPR